MNRSFFNPEESQCMTLEKDLLSVFKRGEEKPNQIHQGMTPSEISDFVSDHMIVVIKNQFESAKQEYLTKNT
jgi:hypothetical protein